MSDIAAVTFPVWNKEGKKCPKCNSADHIQDIVGFRCVQCDVIGIPKNHPTFSQRPKVTKMFTSIAKALGTVVILTLSTIGLGASVVFGMLVNGNITPDQVSGFLTQSLAYVHIYLSGLGIATTGAVMRAAVPHIGKGIKNWFVSILDERISEKLK